jgi:selenocysteine lyase/cysteine desulfurase
VRNAFDFGQVDLQLRREAARYEGGSQNMVGFIGLGASLDLLADLGLSATASPLAHRVLQISQMAISELGLLGAEVLSPRDDRHRSGIVTFRLPGHSPEDLQKRCRAAGVVLSCRGGGLRISPHAYNHEADVERLVEVLRAARH